MPNPEQNKKLVREAFDTLFNRRDYTRAEAYWSPDYIQHSAHIAPGRDGLFDLVKSLPHTLRHETELVMDTANPPRGSWWTPYAYVTGCWSSTGTSSRTRCRGQSR